MKYKEIIVTTFFVGISLLIYAFFPTANVFQQIITSLIFFIVLPFLYNKFILKKNLGYYGFILGDWKKGLLWSFYSLGIVLLIFLVWGYYFNFFLKYRVPNLASNSFGGFLVYELLITGFFVFLYEVYFRGFVLFSYERYFGLWVMVFQAVFFVGTFLLMGGKNLYPFMPYLIFGPLAGIVAYKSKSIIYSGISQLLILIVLDVVTIGIGK